MDWRSVRAKPRFLILLLTVQAVCLGVGLWVQHRFETWSLRQSVVDNAAVHLAYRGQRVVNLMAKPEMSAWLAASTPVDQLRHILELAATSSVASMVLDDNSRVVASCGAHGDMQVRSSPGAALLVTRTQTTGLVAAGVDLVELEQPDGAHIAAVLALPGLRHKLCVHEPKTIALSQAAGFSQSLGSIKWLTMGWIVAVLSVALYTLMSRYVGQLTRERRRSGGRYLRHGDAVVRTRDAVIFGLAKLAESRDPDTGNHLERISIYSEMLADASQSDPRFSELITPAFVRNIGLSSALHDIGKVGIEDGVLLKRGPLTHEERTHMQTHVAIGDQCLRDIEQRLGGSNFLQMAREIVLCHHEFWNGEGYPERLSGQGIPLAARIVAIADFYDALATRRVYKQAFPHDLCVQMIREESGRRFDPDLVEIWLTIEHRFAAVSERFRIARHEESADAESAAQQAELQWEQTPVTASV